MNSYQVLASTVAVGVAVGMASALFNQPAHADAGDPLSGSETAILLGGTDQSTPSAPFAQAVENLYLHPLGFDGGATSSTVCDMIGTDPCAAPLQVLTTPELWQEGTSSLQAADDVTLAVENEFNADPGAFSAEHPLTIFGYSQSATAESIAMSRLAAEGIPSADLHFVFIGDPSLPGGQWPNLEPDLDSLYGASQTNTLLTELGFNGVLGNVTPDDLYPATIYTLAGDGVADFQNDFMAGGLPAVLEGLLVQHMEYVGLTPTQIADATTSTQGDLTYVDISDNINNFDAWIGALENGALSADAFQNLFESLQLYFTNMF